MFKDINDLLNEKKTEEERRHELFSILPSLEEGEKIYYNKDSYIYYDGEDLFNGTDKYSHDNLVKGAFPYIFLLYYVYNALSFASEAKKFEAFKKDKKFKETKEGFITYPEIGVISDSSTIRDFILDFEEFDKEEEKLVKEAVQISETEALSEKSEEKE